MPELPAERFWEYSLAVYSKPGVAQNCLKLQDNHGLNVNLLLLCHWLVTQEYPVSDEVLSALSDAVAVTERTLSKHRANRKAAKGSPQYEALKEQELTLEREQQAALVDALRKSNNLSASSVMTLKRVIMWLGMSQNEEAQQLINTILSA